MSRPICSDPIPMGEEIMNTLTHRTAARILVWCLLPFALLDLWVLLIWFSNPFCNWGIVAFGFFYMVGGLVIWMPLFVLAYGRPDLRFIRRTWGSHVVFNTAASLFWIGYTISPKLDIPSVFLWPLVVTVPVLAWS